MVEGAIGSRKFLIAELTLAPEQLVDRGLGAGALVDLFDDYRAIKARAVGTPAGQRPRHHHRVRRHPAVVHLATVAIDDLGRGADVDAHREHRAGLDDDAFGDLAARADEAIIPECALTSDASAPLSPESRTQVRNAR